MKTEGIVLKKKDCGEHWGREEGPCSKCKAIEKDSYQKAGLLAILNASAIIVEKAVRTGAFRHKGRVEMKEKERQFWYQGSWYRVMKEAVQEGIPFCSEYKKILSDNSLWGGWVGTFLWQGGGGVWEEIKEGLFGRTIRPPEGCREGKYERLEIPSLRRWVV